MPEPEVSLDDTIAAAGGFSDDAPDTTEIAAAPLEAPVTVEDDDFDAVPDHEELSNGVKRVNRIPKPRVAKMLERKLKEAETALLSGFRDPLGLAADAPLTAEEIRKHFTERGTKLTAAEQELAAMQSLVEHPERLLTALAHKNPAYQRYLAPPEQPKPAVQAEPINLDDYSIDLGQGNRTFSFDGLQKFMKAYVAQELKSVRDEYAPLIPQAKAAAEFEERRAKVAPFVQFMNELPGFKENEPEILKLIQSEPVTIQQAYDRVVYQKHVADENAMREKVLAEIKNAPPTSTATTSTPAPAKPQTVDDVIGENILKAMAGAA
jgi:hypothetical protein